MIQVQDNSQNKYFSITPNIIYEIGLTAYEIALYGVLKRTAGDSGASYKGRQRLAKESGMSEGMVTKVKNSLAKKRDCLGGKALITITKRKSENGDNDSDLIIINDIWDENAELFIKQSRQGCPQDGQGWSQHDDGWSQHDDGWSQHDTKKNPIKKNQKKNTNTGGLPPAPPLCVKEHPSEKKQPTQKKERTQNVSTTDQEHERLLSDLGEELLHECYQELSEWKADRPRSKWRTDDNRSIRKWVISTVKERNLKEYRLNELEKKQNKDDDLKGWKI